MFKGENCMKLIIEGNTEEIKNVFQAIDGSKEHKIINSLKEIDTLANTALSQANQALEQIIQISAHH
jgi:hypothetical protein